MPRRLVLLAAFAALSLAGPAFGQRMRPPPRPAPVMGVVGPALPPPRAPGPAAPPKAEPAPPPPPRVPPEQMVPVLTLDQAERAFALMAAQDDIAFAYVVDGCYSRAHLMIQRLRALGYNPGKVWAFGHGEQLYARTVHDPRGYITWSWHVAPTLPVRDPVYGHVVDLVIDPSLFSGPVPVHRWRDAMRRTPRSKEPYIYQSRLGEAPVQADGRRPAGTGYWTSADPGGNLDVHALGTMRRYQAIVDAR